MRGGKDGISESFIAEIERALSHRELIKVRLEKPEDKRGEAALLAERTGAVLCGLLGHTVILYRPNPEKAKRGEPTIAVPGDRALAGEG